LDGRGTEMDGAMHMRLNTRSGIPTFGSATGERCRGPVDRSKKIVPGPEIDLDFSGKSWSVVLKIQPLPVLRPPLFGTPDNWGVVIRGRAGSSDRDPRAYSSGSISGDLTNVRGRRIKPLQNLCLQMRPFDHRAARGGVDANVAADAGPVCRSSGTGTPRRRG
jgi:hypothetical protein